MELSHSHPPPTPTTLLFSLHLNGECLTVTVSPWTQESEGFINPKKMDERKPSPKKEKKGKENTTR